MLCTVASCVCFVIAIILPIRPPGVAASYFSNDAPHIFGVNFLDLGDDKKGAGLFKVRSRVDNL